MDNTDIYNGNPFADVEIKEKPGIDIVKHIGFGRNNAKSRKELCDELQLSDRLVRRLIHDERIRGLAIINVGNGYYIPDMRDEEDIEELKEYIMLMKARYRDIGESLDSLTTFLVYSV